MPPTSGHSGKVRGCCQAPVPVDLSFLCTQQICPMTPHGPPSSSDICQPFLFFCNSVLWLHAGSIRPESKKNTSSKVCKQLHCTNEEMNTHIMPRANLWSPPFFVVFFPFLVICHLEADRHKNVIPAHCWFKVLVEQISGRQLSAKSLPFRSLLSSANFFLGLSESIKELPECSHQSFNYSW